MMSGLSGEVGWFWMMIGVVLLVVGCGRDCQSQQQESWQCHCGPSNRTVAEVPRTFPFYCLATWRCKFTPRLPSRPPTCRMQASWG